MKCWNEVEEDAFSYYKWFSKDEAIKRVGERSDKDRERYMERFRRLERENAKRNNGSLDQVGGQEE